MTEAHYYNERIAHFPGKGMGCWKVGGLVVCLCVCVCVASLNKSQFFLRRAKKVEGRSRVGWDRRKGRWWQARKRPATFSYMHTYLIGMNNKCRLGGAVRRDGRGKEGWYVQGPFGINLFNWAIMKEQRRGKKERRRKGGGSSSALRELNLKVKWLCRPSRALYPLINGPNQKGSGGQMGPVWVRAISPRLACW